MRALAKLTLSLRVTGLRDDGYHLLEAEMVSVDLADELVFSEGDGIDVFGPAAAGVPLDDDNLVRKALAAVARTAHVDLDKHIPRGAGLGGGSADAAAVLRWAGCHDLVVAASVGADVPFCLVGGRARVSGVGEVVEPLAFEEQTFTLLIPRIELATAEVYRAWDHLGGPAGGEGNDLEPAALALEPELVRWRERLGDATGLTPRLAGSGSAWFVEGEFRDVPGAIVTRTERP